MFGLRKRKKRRELQERERPQQQQQRAVTMEELLIIAGAEARGLREAVEDARADVVVRRAELDAGYALRAGAPRAAIEEDIAELERGLEPFDAVLADFDRTEAALTAAVTPDDESEALLPLIDLYVTGAETLAEISTAYRRLLAAYSGALERVDASDD
ncbi:hypothetical protein J5Y04_10175 [Kitasatospora sp. RG8]|uniref:hypothetical protein n=1 Tax=Kitasatospora sp. RG8 TaxID=2820815 RepID=UPI001AE04981|nr:hypothetical protein [Kitasatospora sp. RG8]MBP0449912.1 hypothetical protein [Kitasatospora sp. RG8]